MKLANALFDRSNLEKRLIELKNRLGNNAKVQAGEQPSEDPEALLAELDDVLVQLEKLIAKINLVNSRTIVDGVTLTEMLARRDCLKKRVSIMRSFLDSASQRVERYSRSEIAIKSTVPVSDLQKQVDQYSKELRELDGKIQELNWTTEMPE